MGATFFRYRFLAAFGLVVLALWGAIAFALQMAERVALENARIEGRNLARSLAEHVSLSVRSIDLSLITLRDEWERDPASFARAVARHQKFLMGDAFAQISVIGPDGWLVWSNVPGWQRIDLSDRQHFKVHKERGSDELYVSEPLLGRVSRQWTIQFTRPIYDQHEKFAGVLVLSVPPPALERTYNDIELGEGATIMLARSDGKILAHSHGLDRTAAVSLAGIPGLGEDDAPAGEFRRKARTDGVERLFRYQKVPGYPLTVNVGQAVDTVFAPYRAQRQIYLASGALATALLLALMLLLMSRRGNKEKADQYRAQLASIVQNSTDAIIGMDLDARIVSWNAGAQQLYGYTEAEVVGKPISITVPPDRLSEFATVPPRTLRGERVPHFETVRITKDGRRIDARVTVSPIRNADGSIVGASAIVQDITERKAAEAKIHRLTQLYAALSQCNQAIVRCADENELFPQICRDAVQFGGMKMAWIGLIDGASARVKPVASYGDGSEYLEGIQISVAGDDPSGRGPTGIAIRENQPVWCQDFLNDPRTALWHERGARFGWGASASLPLHRKGVAIGAFTLYAGGANAFDEAARNLLVEMAMDISYALDRFVLAAERKRADADLRIAATAFESQESMMITDAKGVILRVNRAFTDSTGYTAEEAVGQTPRLLQSGRHDAAFFAAMWDSIHRTRSWNGEVWNRRKSGEVYPEWLTINAVIGADGSVTHYVGAQTDITERKAAEDEIQNLAFHDPLTGLPNRRLLHDRLQHALAASTRSGCEGALLFIDLDNFKTLNDTLGHDKGDLLLLQVAQRLATCIREGDTVARLGGDEFVVILEDLSERPQEAATQAEAVSEKISATLNQTYWLAGHEHHSTASIGITLFNDHQDSINDLLKQADLAMYQAKAAGRNTLRFFDPDMQAAVMASSAMETELREAIQKDQLLLYYQAQVDGDGALTGAEALVRWQHPQRGLVSPTEFIPLAEVTGLILPLGHWVLETACVRLVAWAARAEMAHLTLAVNVSVRQFRHPDFVRQVLAVLDRTGADPKKLKLELTESLLVDDVEGTIAKMMTLKDRGVGFSLDDFGTGYSSLSYLKRLPLDQLKIDQSFVRDVLTDPNDAAIARTIVALAQSMGLRVIAEGVETEEQRAFLAQHGCHAFQGYLFSRPLPLDRFELFAQNV
jgi:diguanylate cyclase (GGDEF)-like protein/PAS domain S-box-containing protein